LRYVQQLAWPALDVEPALESERYLRQGAAFHRLAHQHALGIPADHLTKAADDANLRRWWRNYLESGLTDLPGTRYPEIVLSAPIAGYRLVARYDLVAVEPGRRAVIVDWKTSRRRHPRRWLEERLQTRVYPFVLVQAGSQIIDSQPPSPELVEMVYWFASFPADPERFSYAEGQYAADQAYLGKLITEIAGLSDEGFPLTQAERRCRYCRYRSLCRRGDVAGQLDEEMDDPGLGDTMDVSLEFDQIAEILY
jgi:hypothetical protein